MRKNEQCVKRFLAGVLCAAFVLAGMTACGNTKGAEGSVIAVSKDGTVTDTIREPFDQDYYSQQELQDEVLKAVASYNSGMGNEAITVSKVQVDDGVTDVEMKYRSAEDYAAFNRETFFIGTPAQARLSGFDLNKVYTAVSDPSKTMGMAELFNTDGVLVLITDTSRKGTQVVQTIRKVADELVMYEQAGVIINRVPDESIVQYMDLGDLPVLSVIPSDSSLAEFDLKGENVFYLSDDAAIVRGAREALKKLEIL